MERDYIGCIGHNCQICEYDQRKRVQKRRVRGRRVVVFCQAFLFLLHLLLLFLPFYLYPILCPGYIISPSSIHSWAHRSTVILHLIADRTSLDRIRVCAKLDGLVVDVRLGTPFFVFGATVSHVLPITFGPSLSGQFRSEAEIRNLDVKDSDFGGDLSCLIGYRRQGVTLLL